MHAIDEGTFVPFDYVFNSKKSRRLDFYLNKFTKSSKLKMDLAKELEIYYNMVYAEHITETKLVNLLILIKEKCERILQFASYYDYDQTHLFNGYRSMVLFVVKFLGKFLFFNTH